MAERWKFSSFVIFSFVISMSSTRCTATGLGAAAGSRRSAGTSDSATATSTSPAASVVHPIGGVAALAGAIVLGPRMGKYKTDGSLFPIPGHNIPMALLGTFILAFGWFGFNPGSTLAGTDLRIAVIAVNTMLASAAAPSPRWCTSGPLR